MYWMRIKRITKSFNSIDFASIGVGMMIVFIAMVLVAGIAASVLISTSNTLETQAMKTGQDTKEEVSCGIGVIQIIGQRTNRNLSGTFYDRYHNMSIMVTSRAGGTGIDLSQVFVTISNGSKQCLLTWDTNCFSLSPSGGGIFSTAGMYDIDADDFGVIVIEDGDGSCTSNAPVINRGDKAILTVNLSACFNGLSTRQDVNGMVVAEDGSPGVFLFRTPAVSAKTVVKLM